MVVSGSVEVASDAAELAPTEPVVLPSREDPLVAGAVTALGGPPGRRARLGERRFWTPLRWIVLLTLLTSALGFWQKAPCRVHDWTDEYQYTRLCYSDVLALYYSEQLDQGARPYLDHPVEYPVLMGGAMLFASVLTEPVADALPGSRVTRAERELAAARAADPLDPERTRAAEAQLSAARSNARAHTFYDLTWVLLAGCALVVAVTTAQLAGRRRVWDAAIFAVAPGLLVHATTNWDLLAVALAGLGLVAWARSRPLLAGVLLGLGTATKLYPLLLLVPLLALCWRAGRLRAGLLTGGALVLTAAAVTLPVYVASPAFAEVGGAQVRVAGSPWERFGTEGLAALAPHVTVPAPGGGGTVTGVNAVYRFVELNRVRPADWDSVAYALQSTRGELPGPLGAAYDAVADLVLGDGGGGQEAPARLNAAVAVGTLLTVVGVVGLALAAPRRPRLAQLAFLTLTGFLLTNKVFSPQYVLWLLPLAVLARPRWRLILVWQVTEVFLLFTRFYYFISLPLGEGDQSAEGIPRSWFLAAVGARDLALLLLAGAVVREVLRPETDPVRRSGLDDPAGGPLDGTPDARGPRAPDARRPQVLTSG